MPVQRHDIQDHQAIHTEVPCRSQPRHHPSDAGCRLQRPSQSHRPSHADTGKLRVPPLHTYQWRLPLAMGTHQAAVGVHSRHWLPGQLRPRALLLSGEPAQEGTRGKHQGDVVQCRRIRPFTHDRRRRALHHTQLHPCRRCRHRLPAGRLFKHSHEQNPRKTTQPCLCLSRLVECRQKRQPTPHLQ